MPRWISKVTTVTFAGREILSPGQALENNEIEFSSTFDRSFTPTVARRLYALRSPAHSLNISIPVIREFRDASSLLAAAQNEIAFAYGANSTDTLSILSQPVGSLPPTESTSTESLDLKASEDEPTDKDFIFVFVKSEHLRSAASYPCSAIAIEGPKSISVGGAGSSARYLAVFARPDSADSHNNAPTLLAVSTNAVSCAAQNFNTWYFDPPFTIPTSTSLCLLRVQSQGAPEWDTNTQNWFRASLYHQPNILEYGYTEGHNGSGYDAELFPRIVISYAVRHAYVPPSEATSVSYISAFLTELAHRVTTAPKCLRLISTWTFTIDASYVPPSISSDSDDLDTASPGAS